MLIYFSSAVFVSYLRPDLVPANLSFYEGSSTGTVSTSSIFVNVDKQTEDRYAVNLLSYLLLFPACDPVDLVVKCVVHCVKTMMHGTQREGMQMCHAQDAHTHTHTRLIVTCDLTSHGLIGDVYLGTGESVTDR